MIEYTNGCERLTVRRATEAETVDMERLYASVAVNESTIREKLTEGERSFARRGGIFAPLKQEYLAREMKKEGERMIVCQRDGRIGGMLWYGMWHEGLYADAVPQPGMEEKFALIAQEGPKGRMSYSKDIVAADPKTSGVGCFAMFYEMMMDYADNGVPYTCGEVYQVDGWDDGNGYVELNMLNQASFRFLSASGGSYVGDAPRHSIEIGKNRVWITPKIFLWETAKTAETIAGRPEKKNWRMCGTWKPENLKS